MRKSFFWLWDVQLGVAQYSPLLQYYNPIVWLQCHETIASHCNPMISQFNTRVLWYHNPISKYYDITIQYYNPMISQFNTRVLGYQNPILQYYDITIQYYNPQGEQYQSILVPYPNLWYHAPKFQFHNVCQEIKSPSCK